MAEDLVLVVNNERNVLSLRVTEGEDGLVRLHPGRNEVKREQWELAKRMRAVQAWLGTATANPYAVGTTMLVELGTKEE